MHGARMHAAKTGAPKKIKREDLIGDYCTKAGGGADAAGQRV